MSTENKSGADKKAKELVEKFGDKASDVVDEILKFLINSFIPNSAAIMAKDDKDICYWQSVKQSIQKL